MDYMPWEIIKLYELPMDLYQRDHILKGLALAAKNGNALACYHIVEALHYHIDGIYDPVNNCDKDDFMLSLLEKLEYKSEKLLGEGFEVNGYDYDKLLNEVGVTEKYRNLVLAFINECCCPEEIVDTECKVKIAEFLVKCGDAGHIGAYGHAAKIYFNLGMRDKCIKYYEIQGQKGDHRGYERLTEMGLDHSDLIKGVLSLKDDEAYVNYFKELALLALN